MNSGGPPAGSTANCIGPGVSVRSGSCAAMYFRLMQLHILYSIECASCAMPCIYIYTAYSVKYVFEITFSI